MRNILSVYLSLLFISAAGQDINWQKSSNWKMYKISGDKGLGYSADALSEFPFIEMNADTILHFARQASILPKDKYYVWMGAYYVTCLVNDTIHKVDISVHGGFFYDERTKRYYQLPMNMRTDWMDWLITLKKRVNEK